MKSQNESYYTPPYGYQKNGVGSVPNIPIPQPSNQTLPTATPNVPSVSPINSVVPQPNYYQPQQSATYMQSGMGTTANTQTTKSVNTYATSSQLTPTPKPQSQQQQQQQQETNVTPPTVAAAKPQPSSATKKSSNIDLLSDIDFSGVMSVPPPILPEPVLKPVVINSPPASQLAAEEIPSKNPPVPETTPDVVEKTKQVEVTKKLSMFCKYVKLCLSFF